MNHRGTEVPQRVAGLWPGGILSADRCNYTLSGSGGRHIPNHHCDHSRPRSVARRSRTTSERRFPTAQCRNKPPRHGGTPTGCRPVARRHIECWPVLLHTERKRWYTYPKSPMRPLPTSECRHPAARPPSVAIQPHNAETNHRGTEAPQRVVGPVARRGIMCRPALPHTVEESVKRPLRVDPQIVSSQEAKC
ncbi:hypothetical protein GGR26_000454 [Lewinella marina]|nr:hypothetical protein [Neolewinella marina]